jgi:hypothetical protein
MRTLADMELELKQLRTRVNELQGVGREQAQAAEIVDDSDDSSHPTRYGFADLCRQSDADLCESLEVEATPPGRPSTIPLDRARAQSSPPFRPPAAAVARP